MSQKNFFNDYSKIQSELPNRAFGVNLMTYPITLEAWKRGIEVTLYTVSVSNQIRIFYALKNDNRQYDFQLSFGGVMEKSARKIVNSKDVAKKYLESADVPTPKGKMFKITDTFEDAVSYASFIGYPVVTKPLNARNATGVTTNIKNEVSLEKSLAFLRDELGYTEIIIEQYVKGDDTRVYVIEDQVIAAYKRRPANVIGDGVKNINDLINEKNHFRARNPHLKRFKIEINMNLINYIKQQELSLESVPAENKRIYLSDSTLHPDGCETVDVTDELSDNIKEISINAVRAIPGLKISGIDIMVNQEDDKGHVLELNAGPNISGHIFPMEGKARDVPGAFIDHHFPETKNVSRKNYKHFDYDFDSVLKILKSGVVKSVSLPPLPKGKLKVKHYKITGKITRLPEWIHRKALGMRLGGEITNNTEKQLTLKIAGKASRVDSFNEILMKKAGPNIQIKSVNDGKWDGKYQYYFKRLNKTETSVSSPSNKSKNNSTTGDLKDVKQSYLQDIQDQEKRKKALIKEIADIKKSRSWRLTKPLRTLTKRIMNQND